MYRLVICEDDITQRAQIKNDINKIFDDISNQYEIFEYSSGEELLEDNIDGIDIYFLDILMDELSGMDTARKIREKNSNSEIIFITSLVEYIQEGYEVRAYRYLLKPIIFKELRRHIINCIEDIVKNKDNFMMIENKGIIKKVNVDDILYIEVAKRYITVHTVNGIYSTQNSMKNIEKALEIYAFYRCHKSYLVNLKQIISINQDSVKIGDDIIPVSKHRMSDFKSVITIMMGDIIC